MTPATPATLARSSDRAVIVACVLLAFLWLVLLPRVVNGPFVQALLALVVLPAVLLFLEFNRHVQSGIDTLPDGWQALARDGVSYGYLGFVGFLLMAGAVWLYVVLFLGDVRSSSLSDDAED